MINCLLVILMAAAEGLELELGLSFMVQGSWMEDATHNRKTLDCGDFRGQKK